MHEGCCETLGKRKNTLAAGECIFTLSESRVKPVFHFTRIVPKRTGEHAQIEKRFINPHTSGRIRVSK
jgi:hypothetical protein